MSKFFARNIDRRGRLARAIFGLVLTAPGLALSWTGRWYGLALVAAGAFSLYEAARGWCVMRACGVKTKY